MLLRHVNVSICHKSNDGQKALKPTIKAAKASRQTPIPDEAVRQGGGRQAGRESRAMPQFVVQLADCGARMSQSKFQHRVLPARWGESKARRGGAGEDPHIEENPGHRT